MGHRSPHIASDQVEHLGHGRGEARNVQLIIHKEGADPRAGQQVVHVIVGERKIGNLDLQFGIDCSQFFIDRLQLFLGGFHFFIRGLQFLIHGLHFLVGRPQFFVRRFHFLKGGLEILFLGTQFLLE